MLRAFAAWPLERLVGLGLIAVALLFTLLLGALAQRGLRSLTWPVIPGVEYTYNIGGRTYRSRTWTYRSQEPTEAFARRVVARYARGRPVGVHYDPAAPGRAVLEPGTDVFVLGALGVSALILLIGTGLTVSTVPPVSTLLVQRRIRARRTNRRGPRCS